ncbi:MAG: hypothetical protein RIR62_1165 [Pseudomonadota bacterium]
MPRLPTPAEALMTSIQTSIRMAEAGTLFWLSLMNSGLWWLPRELRPAVLPLPDAPARQAAARTAPAHTATAKSVPVRSARAAPVRRRAKA